MTEDNRFSRTRRLLGDAAMERLAKCRVAVFGVGGVGGYVVEALARSGVGALDLCDKDAVDVTNLNRQIIALGSTVGRLKVEVAAERVRDINPECRVTVYPLFYLPETAGAFDFTQYDYVVDAVDTVTAKLMLIEQAKAAGVPIISSMGAGNKLDPTAFRVADVFETSVCPLAKVMRRECRKRGIEHLKVVYSTEEALKPLPENEPDGGQGATENDRGAVENDRGLTAESLQEAAGTGRIKQSPGSVAFVPAVAGLILAGEVVKDLSGVSSRRDRENG